MNHRYGGNTKKDPLRGPLRERGLATGLLGKVDLDFRESVSYICSPPAMGKGAVRELSFLGALGERIIMNLEAHMKCGNGKCGHCYGGSKYLCTDGPGFSYREIRNYDIPL